jgi:RES domain-containing protein
VSLDAHLTRWSGTAFRHLPTARRLDPLAFRHAKGRDNRWNVQGEPTLYLAGDEGVLAAEWSRHLLDNRAPAIAAGIRTRTIYRLDLTVDTVLDVRHPAVWQALSLTNAPYCFTDRTVTRATARYIRDTTSAGGIVVPSVTFLDQLDRWCLVLFLDKLPGNLQAFITSATQLGSLSWSDSPLLP